MSFVLPFNLEHWFLVVFAGNVDIFFAVALLAIAAMAAYFRMPTEILVVCLGMFVAFMSYYLGGIFVFLLVLVGLGVAWTIARIMR